MSTNNSDVVITDNTPTYKPTAVELERLFNPRPYHGMHMTAARRAEIERAIFAGLFTTDIAKKFNCCTKTISKIRRELKDKYRHAYRKQQKNTA